MTSTAYSEHPRRAEESSKAPHLCALCFKINCSNHKNVLLCVTFCRTCTVAFQVFFAASFVQLGHWPVCTTSVNTNVCCKTACAKTSFWIVTLTLTRREWGSVHMKAASMSRTFMSGRAIFFRHMATGSNPLPRISHRIKDHHLRPDYRRYAKICLPSNSLDSGRA